MHLHHVGVVVGDINSSIEKYCKILGFNKISEIYIDKIQDAEICFLENQNGVVELVAPISEKSTVYKFLKTKGGGVHHMCFEVDDINKEIARIRGNGGLIFFGPKPAIAFNNKEIAFIFMKDGSIIEIVQS